MTTSAGESQADSSTSALGRDHGAVGRLEHGVDDEQIRHRERHGLAGLDAEVAGERAVTLRKRRLPRAHLRPFRNAKTKVQAAVCRSLGTLQTHAAITALAGVARVPRLAQFGQLGTESPEGVLHLDADAPGAGADTEQLDCIVECHASCPPPEERIRRRIGHHR